jgi:hypothetical protein
MLRSERHERGKAEEKDGSARHEIAKILHHENQRQT